MRRWAKATSQAWPIGRQRRESRFSPARIHVFVNSRLGQCRINGGGRSPAFNLRLKEIPMLSIGSQAPDFEAETTEGPIRFHDWIGDKWAVLFSHPKDFTPVCTTELGYMARIKPEFDYRGVKIIGLSVDPVQSHSGWARDIKETQGFAPNYPLIGDTDLKVSKLYGMLPAEVPGQAEGRNFDEVLRVIDSLQLTAKHKVATPVNWRQGEDVIIAGSVSDEEARKRYPAGWRAPKPYLRIVPQPS